MGRPLLGQSTHSLTCVCAHCTTASRSNTRNPPINASARTRLHSTGAITGTNTSTLASTTATPSSIYTPTGIIDLEETVRYIHEITSAIDTVYRGLAVVRDNLRRDMQNAQSNFDVTSSMAPGHSAIVLTQSMRTTSGSNSSSTDNGPSAEMPSIARQREEQEQPSRTSPPPFPSDPESAAVFRYEAALERFRRQDPLRDTSSTRPFEDMTFRSGMSNPEVIYSNNHPGLLHRQRSILPTLDPNRRRNVASSDVAPWRRDPDDASTSLGRRVTARAAAAQNNNSATSESRPDPDAPILRQVDVDRHINRLNRHREELLQASSSLRGSFERGTPSASYDSSSASRRREGPSYRRTLSPPTRENSSSGPSGSDSASTQRSGARRLGAPRPLRTAHIDRTGVQTHNPTLPPDHPVAYIHRDPSRYTGAPGSRALHTRENGRRRRYHITGPLAGGTSDVHILTMSGSETESDGEETSSDHTIPFPSSRVLRAPPGMARGLGDGGASFRERQERQETMWRRLRALQDNQRRAMRAQWAAASDQAMARASAAPNGNSDGETATNDPVRDYASASPIPPPPIQRPTRSWVRLTVDGEEISAEAEEEYERARAQMRSRAQALQAFRADVRNRNREEVMARPLDDGLRVAPPPEALVRLSSMFMPTTQTYSPFATTDVGQSGFRVHIRSADRGSSMDTPARRASTATTIEIDRSPEFGTCEPYEPSVLPLPRVAAGAKVPERREGFIRVSCGPVGAGR
ncbi:hypothetical protein K474DRAFT_1702411 [Panus rudis PR-1116 ss-1]|nr:hypothetical protein K474DRAFT_1702411 [Panus rudis PR-1116 ss-1]